MDDDTKKRTLISESREEVEPGQVPDGSEAGDGPIAADDPFSDLSKFRLNQNFAHQSGVRKLLTTVPVHRPNRQWFIRVHPDDSWHLDTAVLDLEEDQETYLVDPSLMEELSNEIRPVTLFTAVNRQALVFLWPVRLPPSDGHDNPWHRSAREAAQLAKRKWCRVASNRALGTYEVYEATGNLPEPEWPDVTFEELLRIAFRDRFIQSRDHPGLQRLRGEK